VLICLQADCTSADVAEWNKVDSFDSNYDFLNNPLEEKCDYQVMIDVSAPKIRHQKAILAK